MSDRLEQLLELRRQIDIAIKREERTLGELQELRANAGPLLHQRQWDERVIALSTAHFGLDPLAIFAPSRQRKIVDARWVAAWIMRQSNRSYPEIAKVLGMGDHTTAINACQKVEERPELRKVAVELHETLTGKPLIDAA